MVDWSGLIMVEGELTGDGRRFESGSIRWPDPPLPLKLSHELDAPVVGNVTSITRDGNNILAAGTIDDSTPDGLEAVRRLDDTQHEAYANGVSVEIDEMEAEVRVDPIAMSEGENEEVDEDGKITVWKMGAEQEILVVTDARIRALALSTVAAFSDAKITLKNKLTAAMARIMEIVQEALTAPMSDDYHMVAPIDTPWDPDVAKANMVDFYTDDSGVLDVAEMTEYFLYVDPDGDPTDPATYDLGYTDLVDVTIGDADPVPHCMTIPDGVAALPDATDALLGDGTPEELAAIHDRICGLFAEVQAEHPDFDDCPYAPEPVVVEGTPVEEAPIEEILASAVVTYRADLFDDPQLDGPTGVTVSDVDGIRHLVGHLALWETCHTAFDGQCVMPPGSKTGYNGFMLHSVQTDRGPLPVGKITVDTTHAGRQANARETVRHYEVTGAQAAVVRVGEDSFGIWVAGVIPAQVTDEAARCLLEGSPLSGDWRWDPVSKNLELRGILAVNIPGFPVPRYAMAASGVPASVQVGYDPRAERAIEKFRIALADAEMVGV